MKPNKFAVIGGSIAGSACATILHNLGYDVTVFEKSAANSFVDRGAGMWLSCELVQNLIDRNVLSSSLPGLIIKERPINSYTHQTKTERLITSHMLKNTFAVHWRDVFECLKQKCPENKVVYDATITKINHNPNSDKLELSINNRYTQDFDYCIFADGVNSFGRKYLFPDKSSTFADTIVWRGTLDRVDNKTSEKFLEKGVFYVYERGHLLIYLIPNRSGHDPRTNYKINWLVYEHIDSTHELFKHNLAQAQQNIIKGNMPQAYLNYLHTKAQQWFPEFECEIITSTKDPFTQAVYELLPPSYTKGRVVLIGDASTLLRPHTAAGAAKALTDVIALEQQLSQNSDIQVALNQWNKRQSEFGKELFNLGQTLGQIFVTNMPNWQTITKEGMDEIWQNALINCWYADKK